MTPELRQVLLATAADALREGMALPITSETLEQLAGKYSEGLQFYNWAMSGGLEPPED
jgi:hypothetical protein